ncbi:MAG: dihydrofolate reductase family protein [Patescibacteria group bacterium]
MKVFIIAAVTADGFIARNEDDKSFDWTSPEDKKFYVKKIKEADAIVMGRKSFETFTRYPRGSRWLIYTSKPEDFKNPKPSVIKAEGVNSSARELLGKLKKEKSQQVAICGGSSIYTMFLNSGLVDKLFITVEEDIKFGTGMPLFNDGTSLNEKRFKLIDIQQLAEQTRLLEYQVCLC